MKITHVEALQLKNPVEAIETRGGHPLDLGSTLVRIHTDEGVSGVGQSWLPGSPDDALGTHVRTELSGLLIGEDPLDSVRLWHKMWAVLYRRGGFARGLSAVDQALWDIKGKQADMPVFQLLGGKAQPYLVPYVTSPMQRQRRDVLVEDIMRFREQGFQAAKLIVGQGSEKDRDLITYIHDRVGDKVKLAMDANGGCDFPEALKLSRIAESLGFMWFEEPLPWYDISGLAALRGRVDIPIAGFQEVSTIWRLREYLEKDALSIYNVTVGTCGGVTVVQKMGALLEAWHRRMVPHGFGPPVCYAATLHTAIAQPNVTYVEFPIPDRLNPEPRRWSTAPYVRNIDEFGVDADGHLCPPDRPGLGIELDEAVLKSLVVQ